MAKDPAFLFYPSDFLTGTMFMSNAQVGIYIRLLCSQHQHGGLINKISFASLVGDDQLLKSKFIETESGFYNERLAIEMEKRNAKSTNLSEAAKAVWAKRKEEKNTIALQKQSKSKAKVNENDTIVIRTENEDVNKNKIIKGAENLFETWWNLYDKKIGREKCLKKWLQIDFNELSTILGHTPPYMASTPDKRFRKDPLTYLNGKHWNDEIIVKKPPEPELPSSLHIGKQDYSQKL